MDDPKEVSKSQGIRLLDIFLLGPFMIWYATTKRQPKLTRSLMAAFGIGTVLYNLHNYNKTEELQKGN